ncbi:hypothetical protein NG796_16835 [Laspinema sp. A4]|uniref:hypothetical protein n=1 Tax=Laspinema sp. D2d TaxID=2953686 RepID=UPI0021BA4E5F|nr:hypothetical protein [Laspinema sp. D2d]MCT7984939.1 hypothetical protein [Laspinema sp. D2d]
MRNHPYPLDKSTPSSKPSDSSIAIALGKKPIWQLTEAGHEYGQVYLATNDQWSGAQIHWQSAVIELMADRN